MHTLHRGPLEHAQSGAVARFAGAVLPLGWSLYADTIAAKLGLPPQPDESFCTLIVKD